MGKCKMKLVHLGKDVTNTDIKYSLFALILFYRGDTKIARIYNAWGVYLDLYTLSGATISVSSTTYEDEKTISITSSTAIPGIAIYV